MSRPCSACTHPRKDELNRRLRSGALIVDIVRWLKETERPIARNALSRHANQHLGVSRTPGPLPPATGFLEKVVAIVDRDVEAGVQRPTIPHALAAQAELNRQTARGEDRDLMARLAMVLSGAYEPSVPRNVTPADELLDAWLSALGDGRDQHDARQAVEAVAQRLGLPAGDAVAWVTGDPLPGETAEETHARIAVLNDRVGAFG